jgi:ATP-binding cassette subfamily B protein
MLERKSEVSVGSVPANNVCKGHVKFEGVSFSYASSLEPGAPTGAQVLSDVNLEVKPGQAVVLMGPSGCGKSTTGRLLLGLYRPTSGRITIDGEVLTAANAKWFRSHMGVVEQEAPLWSCSILENIRYGDLEATDKDVEQAARTANAHEFISAMPRGYKTVLDKGGITLSGGQRQRLAIARAIIKKPPILLLDEATAALDADSEAVVLEALKKAMEGRTVLAIAHNDATITQLADVIATMVPNKESKEGGCNITAQLTK